MPIQRLPTRALSGAITTANLPPQISINSSASAGALAIDANSRITMPYQPAFQVRLSATQSISANVRTKVNFDTIDYENGSNYSTANLC